LFFVASSSACCVAEKVVAPIFFGFLFAFFVTWCFVDFFWAVLEAAFFGFEDFEEPIAKKNTTQAKSKK
jgi:hypothetical protein